MIASNPPAKLAATLVAFVLIPIFNINIRTLLVSYVSNMFNGQGDADEKNKNRLIAKKYLKTPSVGRGLESLTPSPPPPPPPPQKKQSEP